MIDKRVASVAEALAGIRDGATVPWLAAAPPVRVGSRPEDTFMPDDARTVPVTLDLDPETAAALGDPATRARVERLIRRTVKPASIERLFEVMDAISIEAERRGLTEEILEAELEAHNAGRRDLPRAS